MHMLVSQSLIFSLPSPQDYGIKVRATSVLEHHVERLRSAKVLADKFAWVQKFAANELRAAVAASATMNLNSPEMKDAYRNQSKRLRMEKKLANIRMQKKTAQK